MSQRLAPAMAAAGGGSLLFTGGGFAHYPAYAGELVSLAAGKSALRGLVLALAPHLQPHGLNVRLVSIMGTVDPSTAYHPDAIAEAFWSAHTSPGETEILFAPA
jgi:NAD(P)-dependent dehydrogenase (short-subunit alcohol dehydrogenase family)